MTNTECRIGVPLLARLEAGMGNYTHAVVSTMQFIGHIILFKLSKGFTVIWVLIMFYKLDVCNISMYYP